MTNKEILQKAIEIARKQGMYDNILEDYAFIDINKIGEAIIFNKQMEKIIFSHDFAKAFWGKWEMIAQDKSGIPIPIPFTQATQRGSGQLIWQYHLQQMVLEKEPLLYIKKFL